MNPWSGRATRLCSSPYPPWETQRYRRFSSERRLQANLSAQSHLGSQNQSRQSSRKRNWCVRRSPRKLQCTQRGRPAALHSCRYVQSGLLGLDQTLPCRSCNCSSLHLQQLSTVSVDDISRRLRTRLYKARKQLRTKLELDAKQPQKLGTL